MALRLLAVLAVVATSLIAVPGSVTPAAAQSTTCPVGTTLGTTSWGSGTGGMVWNNNTANSVSGASRTYPNVAGPVDMTVSYTDPDNVNEDLDNPYLNFVPNDSWDAPVYTRTNGTYGANFFTIVMNSLNSDQTVDWSFAFDKPVFVPDFTVSDIDWAGYGYNSSGIGTPHESFQDEVILAGQRGGNDIAITATGGSGIVDLGNGRLVAGTYTAGVNGNVGPADAAGTAALTPVGPITSFNMQYSNGPDDAAADALDGSPPAPIPANSPGVSNNHAVAISNFTICAGNLRFGDRVWADVDGDGVQDTNEPGIAGVVVSISDPDGNVVETQTTDATGAYEFEQFPGFTWIVSIDPPANHTPTHDRDGGDFTSTAIDPTTNEFDIDFGLRPDPGTITGTVLTDRNNNGTLESGNAEVGIPGVTIQLDGVDLGGNIVTGTATTGADGTYTFTGVPAGTHQISEIQPAAGFVDGIDTPGTQAIADGNDQHLVTLAPLQSSSGNDFAEVPDSSIAGTVFEDSDDDALIDVGESGIAGVIITVSGTDVFGNSITTTTTTDTDGTYLVPFLVSGTYTVTETQPAGHADGRESLGSNGGTIGPDAFTGVTLAFDDDATDYDFGELPISSIVGTVTDDLDAPISDVTITLTGIDDLGAAVSSTTTTAADGTYTFDDLRPGTYTVTETQPIAYGDGADDVGFVNGVPVGTLGNDVISDIALAVGDDGVGYDFTETLGSIAGAVVDDDGGPIAGVAIALSGTDASGRAVAATTTTAPDGSYVFGGLVGGVYTVTETQPVGYGNGGQTAGSVGGDDTSVDDQISAISLGGGIDATGYDFDEARSSLSGRVFVDPDNDGVFGSGDSPEAGVTITLAGTNVFGASVTLTTTTGPDGSYTFAGLIEGTYRIDETQPAGLVDGIDTVGSAGGDASVNDRFDAITLGAGIDGTDYDFAELPPAGVTGSVTDADGNPIAGVTLTLTGTSTSGTPISETTTTEPDGSYRFFDLPPGTYTVTETQPLGYGDGPDSIGSIDGSAVGILGNDVISNIVLDTRDVGVDYDFTETLASIAGSVVDDGGNGIAGVTIDLTGTDELGAPVVASTTTAADGSYSFNGLFSGTYTVTETQPIAYGDGGQSAGSAGGDATSVDDEISGIVLGGGVDATGYDFDETLASLRGRVYEDTDNDGTDQGGEPRISGATITLTGTDVLGGSVDRTATTNGSGNYRFDGLLAGTYTVTETQPAGYIDGIDTAGTAGGNASTTNDQISGVALAGGQVATNYLFGELLPSSISGTVFDDDNDDGAQSIGEAGIGGVTMTLTGADDLGTALTVTTTTAGDGTYTFSALRPGTYTVIETQPSAFLDGADTAGSAGGTVADDVISAIRLPSNTAATGYDFAELEASAISGTVVDDGGNPIENVTVTLTGTDDLGASVSSSTNTALDGTYAFDGLRPGTYTLTETQPVGYGDGGETAGTAGGTVTDDAISAISLASEQNAIGYDFDETRGSISGVVYEDINNNGTQDVGEPGIAGVSIGLLGTDAYGMDITRSATTAPTGTFQFDALVAGTYELRETQPVSYADGIDATGSAGGSTATNDRFTGIVLLGGAAATDYSFGEIQPSSIAGSVIDDAGVGIPGVSIELSGTDDLGASVSATTTTAADGTYDFSALRPGTYIVTETQPAAYLDGSQAAGTAGGDATTTNDTISAIALPTSTDATGYDFDEIRASSLSGTVVDDAGSGIPGVTITLTGTDDLGSAVSATTTTAIDGAYDFVGLRPGTYTINETQPTAYGDGGQASGSAGGDDASVNDEIAAISLSANTDATGYDFDETRGSITSLVFEDTNNNGAQDTGETGIGGVTVELAGTDVNGASVSVTSTTLANGIARFDDLLAGTYTITETQPSGHLDGIDTAGTAGGDATVDDLISAITLDGGENASGYTFGELRASRISGSVFDDDNGNGIQDTSEAGVAGVTVTLSGTDDLGTAVSATTTTLANGSYSFTGLRPGVYTVTETQPAAFLDGIDSAGTAGGDTSTNDIISAISLAPDTAANGYDFGEIDAASISGSVIDDAGTGIAGVTITLTGTDDLGTAVSATTTTAIDGAYDFVGLRPGTYTITQTQPAAYGNGGETAGTAGGVTADDQISAIDLASGEDATGYDFDETRGSIAGVVFEDTNNNGAQDIGETGISGVTIDLAGTDVLGAAITTTTSTAANGSYSFDALLAGTYTVTETQPSGYLDGIDTAGTAGGTVGQDQTSTITLTGETNATGYTFGELLASSIAGSVVDEAGTGIAGVTVTLTGTDDLGTAVSTTTTTLADGTYTFIGLRPGTYTIIETQPAAYGDGGETAGTAGGLTSDDTVTAITLGTNTNATGYDFDETRGSITGTVYEDLDGSGQHNGTEPGINGVTIELAGTDVLGTTISLTTTTVVGTYSFDDLLAGTYTITQTQPAGYADGQETIGSSGGTNATNDQITLSLAGGTNATDYDFGEVRLASLTGSVFVDSDNSGTRNGTEPGVDGAVITLSGTDDLGAAVSIVATTGTDGGYDFANLRPGTYTITETQPVGLSDGLDRVGSAGGTLGNDVITGIILGSAQDATGYDFGELEGASISGTVVDDAGSGIVGTTITLSGTDDLGAAVSASTTTGANGTYIFGNLRPGTYTVTESQPVGYGDGGETAGTAGGTVSDDRINAITIGSGQTATGYDFDETTASISGSVYLDANGNGVRDVGETGLPGVPVELTGTDDVGAAITRSVTSLTDGSFTFSDLISGTYTLTQTSQPAGLVDGLETTGTSGGVAGNTLATNDEITAIVLAAGVDATGYLFGEWDTSAIGGTVVDELGNPIPGVTLTLTGVEDDGGTVLILAITGPSGVYTFSGLEPGTYTIIESQPSAYGDGGEVAGTVDGITTGAATDDQIASIVLGPNGIGAGYDFIETLGSISGTVFEDADGDGTLGTEPGIDNVTLTLTGTDANGATVDRSTTTGTDGSYTFDDLVGGTYAITQTQPAGYLDGAETIGSAGGMLASNDVIDSIVTTSGADESGYDFGEIDAASVSGSVVDDAGTPIAGVAISLTGTDDLGAAVSLSDVTDVTGVYSFDGLRPGTYTVAETQPVGYGDGGETAGPVGGSVTDDQIAGIVLGPDTDATGNDFDEIRSEITGRVFEDLDSSGSPSAGEPGISGVTITLTGTDVLGATVDRTTTTSGTGDFTFAGLIAGTYTLTETQPIGFADGDDTVGSAGGDGTTQNDVVSAIAVGPGAVDAGYLFGEVAPVSVTGIVFIDRDNDGSSSGETGIGGVVVDLSGIDDRGQLVNDSTTTAGDGTYAFTGLRPGVYAVSETQPGAFLDGLDSVGAVDGTTTGTLGIDQVTGIGLTSGQSGSGYDFGELEPSSISGSVVDDLGRPIADVAIGLSGTDDLGAAITRSTSTASDGVHTFTGLRPGTYTVTENQPAGYGDGGETAGTIAGTTTGTTVDDQISAIILGAGVDGIGYDFDETTASISGRVFVDNNGDTMPSTGDTDLTGVTIQINGADVNGLAVTSSTTTAADGSYSFDGLLAGTYTITETQPAGFLDGIDTAGTAGGAADNSVGGDEISGVALAAGSSSTGNDFSEVEGGSISGSVVDDGGNGISGVTITLSGTDLFGQPVTSSETTQPDGTYSFTGLMPGTYSITETQPVAYGDGGESVGTIDGAAAGVGSDDAISSITVLSGQDGIAYDFDETRMSISGTVVIDADNDGVADAGETPISGVTLTLVGTDALGATVSATTTTAANGTYRFGDLLAGTYTITETQPAGLLDGRETAGSAGGTVDSAIGADAITGVTVLAGVDAVAYDFGELEPATLGGAVIDDIARPISGVTITLTGTDDLGATITTSVTTAVDGTYRFTDLRPGTYTITETQPAAFGDGGQVAGTTGGVVTDDQVSSITVTSGDVGTGYDFDETTASLTGVVVHATGSGDAPISGVAIELSGTDTNGTAVSASTVTAADGSYRFEGLLAGTYTITETQPAAFADGPERIGTVGGDASTNDIIAAIPLGAGIEATGYDFTEIGTVISGRVHIDRTGDGVPDPTDDLDLSGILIELIGSDGAVLATTTTATDGTYVIGGLLAGDYTVRQTQPVVWGSISPNDVAVRLPITGLANIDFDEEGASISGTVFADTNTNGVDDQATSLTGVTITLAGENGIVATTTTDADGNYTFIGLPAADYTVTVGAPPGTTFTIRDVGADDAIDSDVESATGSVSVTLAAGADIVDVDAGIVEIEQDLAIVITTAATDVNVGDDVVFTTTVTNSGNTVIEGGVTVTIPIPTNTTFVSATGEGWTITVDNGIVTATRPDTLDPGEATPPITLVVEPTRSGTISVTGQVVSSSGIVETTTSNNVSSVPVIVTATTTSIPDLAYTGSSILLLLLIAGGLIASGRTLMLIGSPRRRDDDI